MSEIGFIKEEKLYLLDEDKRSEDLIGFEEEVDKLKGKLNYIKNGSILGFIGDFGTGKTTLLNQLKESVDGKWIDFDAWKYPNREYLWENFVLEFARQIDKKNFDDTIKKIDGTKNEDKETVIKMIYELPGKWADYVPGIKSIKEGVEYLLNTSPAKRTFEIQNILLELIQGIEEESIYIVIEDIDRSGDAGLYFLETLHYFLNNNSIKENKNIKVIVPISTQCYEYNKISYHKCIDYEYLFNLENPDLNNFVNTLFKEDMLADYQKKQIQSFLEATFMEFPTQMTLRILKSILRNSNTNYKNLYNLDKKVIDPRLNIMFQTANNLINNSGRKFLTEIKENKNNMPKHSIFGAILNCIMQDNHKIRGEKLNSIYKEERIESGIVYRLQTLPSIKFVIGDFSYEQKTPKDSILYMTPHISTEQENNYCLIPSYYVDII